ncbi:MAG: MlaD family protein [Pseudomonadota bacterium]
MNIYFKFKHINKLIGAFAILAFFILLAFIVMIARGQKWFQDYAHYQCSFSKSGGIKVGAPVTINDLQAGSVKKLVLDDENRVTFSIEVFKEYSDRIREGTQASLYIPFVGQSTVVLKLGDQSLPLIPEKGAIKVKDMGEGDLGAMITSATKLLDELNDPDSNLQGILNNVEGITKRIDTTINKEDGTFRLIMEHRDLYDQAIKLVKHANEVMGAVANSSGDVEASILEARRALEEANKIILALEDSFLLKSKIQKLENEPATLVNQGR